MLKLFISGAERYTALKKERKKKKKRQSHEPTIQNLEHNIISRTPSQTHRLWNSNNTTNTPSLELRYKHTVSGTPLQTYRLWNSITNTLFRLTRTTCVPGPGNNINKTKQRSTNKHNRSSQMTGAFPTMLRFCHVYLERFVKHVSTKAVDLLPFFVFDQFYSPALCSCTILFPTLPLQQ